MIFPVPPLEDVPSVLEKIESSKEINKMESPSEKTEKKSQNTENKIISDNKIIKAKDKNTNSGFGGMKKGFLFGSSKPATKKVF